MYIKSNANTMGAKDSSNMLFDVMLLTKSIAHIKIPPIATTFTCLSVLDDRLLWLLQ